MTICRYRRTKASEVPEWLDRHHRQHLGLAPSSHSVSSAPLRALRDVSGSSQRRSGQATSRPLPSIATRIRPCPRATSPLWSLGIRSSPSIYTASLRQTLETSSTRRSASPPRLRWPVPERPETRKRRWRTRSTSISIRMSSIRRSTLSISNSTPGAEFNRRTRGKGSISPSSTPLGGSVDTPSSASTWTS